MARWAEFEKDVPEFAARVRVVLDRHKHKTLATLRGDGSPRISGAEIQFAGADVFTGSMPGAVKGRDLRRDPGSRSTPVRVRGRERPGVLAGRREVRRAGRAGHRSGRAERVLGGVREPDPAPEGDASDLFRIEVAKVVLVTISLPHMVIESWHEGVGHRRRVRL